MISQASQQRSSTSHKSLASMHSNGRLHSFNSEADGDPIKVKMTPRVAVRDKTPHRFQIVPLREISQRPIDGVNALALPNVRQNQNPLTGKVGPCNMSSNSHSTTSPFLVFSSKRICNDTSSLSRQPFTEVDRNVELPDPLELYLEGATSKTKRPQSQPSSMSSLKSFPNQAALLLPSTSLSASSLSPQPVEHRRQDVHTKSSSFIAINELASPRSHLKDRTPRPVRKQTMTLSENLYNGRSEYVSEGNVKPMIKHRKTAGHPSSKRNAIYNQPLYTDFLNQTDIPEEFHDGVTDATADFAALDERQENACPQPPPVYSKGLHERSLDVGEEDPNNIDTTISPSASHQYAMDKAFLKSLLPTLLPTQPLRCSRTHSVRVKPFSEGKVVYSSIVLELMSDIDKELEGWKNTLPRH